MNVFHHVRSILEEENLEEEASLLVKPKDPVPFVTISRQTGAGGHSLATCILDEMSRLAPTDSFFEDWYVFDSLLCNQVLESYRFKIPLPDLEKEEFHSPFEDFACQLLEKQRCQSDTLRKISMILRGLAKRGKVIIIGRGGVCLTKDLPAGVHLRLRAPLPIRTDRMISYLKTEKRIAERTISNRDAVRARLMKNHFLQNIDDPEIYHAIFNTYLIPVRKIAPLVIDMINLRRQPNPSYHWSLQ